MAAHPASGCTPPPTPPPPPLPRDDDYSSGELDSKVRTVSLAVTDSKPCGPNLTTPLDRRTVSWLQEIAGQREKLKKTGLSLEDSATPCWRLKPDPRARAFMLAIQDRKGSLRPHHVRELRKKDDPKVQQSQAAVRLGVNTGIDDPMYLEYLADRHKSDEEKFGFLKKSLGKMEQGELKAIFDYLVHQSVATSGEGKEVVPIDTLKSWLELADRKPELYQIMQGILGLLKNFELVALVLKDPEVLREQKASYLKAVLREFSGDELSTMEGLFDVAPPSAACSSSSAVPHPLQKWASIQELQPLIDVVKRERFLESQAGFTALPMATLGLKVDFTAARGRLKKTSEKELSDEQKKALEKSREASQTRLGTGTAFYDPDTITDVLRFKKGDIKEMREYLRDTFVKFSKDELTTLRDLITNPSGTVLSEKSKFFRARDRWISMGKSHGVILLVINNLLGTKDPITTVAVASQSRKTSIAKSSKTKKIARLEAERHRRRRAGFVDSMVHYESRDSAKKEGKKSLDPLEALQQVLPRIRLQDLQYYLEYKISEQTLISMHQKEKADALRKLDKEKASVAATSADSSSSKSVDDDLYQKVATLTEGIKRNSNELASIRAVIDAINEEICRKSDPNYKPQGEVEELSSWFWSWFTWGSSST